MKTTVTSAADIGRRIRAERKALGMTQDDLAAACGVSPRFLREVERGRASAGTGKVLAVLAMLGVRVVLESPDAGADAEPGEGSRG